MCWDRFDICEAWYTFASLYHGGQWSPEYRIFGRLDRMRFSPGVHVGYPDRLGDNARVIFDALVERHAAGETIGFGAAGP